MKTDLDIIFFIYGLAFVLGLAFVVMGLSIAFQPKKESEFKIANILWILAMFGITHGVHEWLDMWAIIRGVNPALDLVRWFVLIVSYIFLFEFARRLFRISASSSTAWYAKSVPLLSGVVTISIVVLILVGSLISANFPKTGSIMSRYLLCFPAGFLICEGLRVYYFNNLIIKQPRTKKYFCILGWSLFFYGILDGLVVPEGNFFPANWLNTASFYSVVKIPVQLFRAFCAFASAVATYGLLSIFRDESLRKIHNALAERDTVTEGIDEGIYLVDMNFRVIWANKKEKDTYGEIVGDYCYHFTHKRNSPCDQPEQYSCPVIGARKTNKPQTFIHTHFNGKGEPRYIEVSAYPVKDKNGEIVNFVHISRDVTEKMKLEETIRSISDPLVLISPKGKIAAVNPMALELTGYIENELMGKQAGIIFSESEEEEEEELFRNLGLEVLLKEGFIKNHKMEIFSKRRHKIQVNLNASLVKYKEQILGIVCVLRDLREIRNLQEQLIQAEKLSALGLLAGGVAHELNNPLAGILGLTQLLIMDTEQSAAQYQDYKDIESAVLRCKNIVAQLLQFSRRGSYSFSPVNVNEAVENALVLVEYQTKLVKIKIEKNLTPGVPLISGNLQQLEQVFINLITNAKDAMPAGGTLTITTKLAGGARATTVQSAVSAGDSEASPYVEVCFTDTGEGIPEEIINKILDPFFTTKSIGKGTGLGLSVCSGIIEKHKGKIQVESAPGKGTTFTLLLPYTQAAVK